MLLTLVRLISPGHAYFAFAAGRRTEHRRAFDFERHYFYRYLFPPPRNVSVGITRFPAAIEEAAISHMTYIISTLFT